MNVEIGKVEVSLRALGSSENNFYVTLKTVMSSTTVYYNIESVSVKHCTFESVVIDLGPENMIYSLIILLYTGF